MGHDCFCMTLFTTRVMASDGFRVWGLGFSVQGAGFRVLGVGFRVVLGGSRLSYVEL